MTSRVALFTALVLMVGNAGCSGGSPRRDAGAPQDAGADRPDGGIPRVDAGYDAGHDAGRPEAFFITGTVRTSAGSAGRAALWASGTDRVRLSGVDSRPTGIRLLDGGAVEVAGTEGTGDGTTFVAWTWSATGGVVRTNLSVPPVPVTASAVRIGDSEFAEGWIHTASVEWPRDPRTLVDGRAAALFARGRWHVFPTTRGDVSRYVDVRATEVFNRRIYAIITDSQAGHRLWIDGSSFIDLSATGTARLYDLHASGEELYILGTDDTGWVYWVGDGVAFERRELGALTAFDGGNPKIRVVGGRIYLKLHFTYGSEYWQNRPAILHRSLTDTGAFTRVELSVPECGSARDFAVTTTQIIAVGNAATRQFGYALGCDFRSGYWLGPNLNRPRTAAEDAESTLLWVVAEGQP